MAETLDTSRRPGRSWLAIRRVHPSDLHTLFGWLDTAALYWKQGKYPYWWLAISALLILSAIMTLWVPITLSRPLAWCLVRDQGRPL
jgi:hypothetical protein